MRKEKSGIRYFGFNELAKEQYGMEAASKQIQNVGKRKDMAQKYEKNNFCGSCKQPLTYIGGNIVCCKNAECKKPTFKLLDNKAKNYVQAIFGEEGETI